jgi:ClpA/ClpB-like protein
MFEKFTERARKVMSLARQHAQRLNNDFIGTEHILLGLLEEDGGVAAKTLKLLGVDKQVMKKEIEKVIKPSDEPTRTLGQLPWSPRAKKVLQLTEEETFRAGADVIGTEHLLLGLFKEGEGIAFQVMSNFKITEHDLRARMQEVLGPDAKQVVGPVVVQKPKMVAIKVWLFKAFEGQRSVAGSLFYNNIRMELETVIQVDGIPFERQEIVAASLARDCNAVAYLIEPVKQNSSWLAH